MNSERRVPMRGWAAGALLVLVVGVMVLVTSTAHAASVSPSASQSRPQVPLIPVPASAVARRGTFVVSTATEVVAHGADAQRIARYFVDVAARTTGLRLREAAGKSPSRAITFTIDAGAPEGEGYSLDVSNKGIVVRAREARGLFYGAVSLWQLTTGSPRIETGISISAVKIEDAPRFAWRGLMLDVARHFLPPEGVKQLLDQMALHKLNTFHWHLTDDQGWRIQIVKYPRLTEVGARRMPAGADQRVYGGFYTQDEIRDIVRYAAERFITVVPEIEMPGHAQAAIAAYPELGTEGPRPPVSSDWGVHTYLFNVEESTFSFLEDVLTEVMALFPSQYIHSGGDEAAKDRWRASPRIQQRMKELGLSSEAALQGYFTARIGRFLNSHGRRLIGWDEILEGGVPASAAVMSWRGEAGAREAAGHGHDVVMAPSPNLYLDYLQSDAPDEPPGRPRYATLQDMYNFQIVPAGLTDDAARRVIGAQINAWTEHMRTPDRLSHAIFPRIAAFAENVWSGAKARDWRSFVERLPSQLARYDSLAVKYADSAYAVRIAGTGVFRLSNQIDAGEIRYTLDGSEPTVESPLYTGFLETRTPVTIAAAAFRGAQRLSAPRRRVVDRSELLRRSSDELKSCSNKLPLRLEDDAPFDGPRGVLNVDILDPCWIYERADLSRATAIAVTVGQVPFNFQVGEDAKKIPLHAPASAAGELEVRVGSCEGDRIAVLPLAPAMSSPALTSLPSAKIASRPGPQDLCLRFTRRSIDPIWVIDSVQLVE
jgi:hexosaminidase